MGRRRIVDKLLPKSVYRHGTKFRMRIYLGTDRRPAWHYFKADTMDGVFAEHLKLMKTNAVLKMSDIFVRYQSEELPKKAQATQTSDIAALKALAECFGHLRPESVTSPLIIAYIDARGSAAPIRANREAALLSHIFTKCRHWGVLDINPAQKLHYRNPETPRTRYVTARELRLAMKYAEPTIRYAMWLCVLTGLRRADILGLTWGAVQSDAMLVELSKSKRRGAVPKKLAYTLSRSLSKVLVRAGMLVRTRRPDGRVFGAISAGTFARRWTILQDKLESKGVQRFQMKDLRAKYGTDLEARGGDPTRDLAHSSAAITRRHYQRKPLKVDVQ